MRNRVISAARYKRAMTGLLGSLNISAIIIVAPCLFAVVELLVPSRRLAIIFKCAILAAALAPLTPGF